MNFISNTTSSKVHEVLNKLLQILNYDNENNKTIITDFLNSIQKMIIEIDDDVYNSINFKIISDYLENHQAPISYDDFTKELKKFDKINDQHRELIIDKCDMILLTQ